MKIVATYFESAAVKKEKSARDAPNVSHDFQNYMDKVAEAPKNKNEPRAPAQMKSNESEAKNPQPKPKSQADAEQKPEPNVTVKNDNPAETQPKAEPIKNIAAVTGEKPSGDISEDNGFAAAIANALMIPVETVVEALDTLDFEAADLTDKANLTAFVTELYDMKEPVELLKIPEIGEIMAKINGIVIEAEKPAEQPVFSETLTGVLDKTDASVPEAPVEITARPEVTPQQQTVIVQASAPKQPETVLPEPQVETVVVKTEEPVVKIAEQRPPSGESLTRSPDEAPAENDEEFIPVIENEEGVPVHATVTRTGAEAAQTVNRPAAVQREVMNQIFESVRAEVRGNVTEVRLLLRPESLGEVSLKIATDNGIVTAQFMAQNQRVRQIIESNFNELRDILTEKGIEVSALSVSVNNGETNEAMESYMRESARTAARASRILSELGAETPDSNDRLETEAYGATVEYQA